MENNKPEDRVETVGDIKYKITYVPCTCPCHSSGGTMKHFMPCCQDGYTKTSTEIKEEKKGISISPGAFSGINAPSPWDAYRTKENGEKAMPFEMLLNRMKQELRHEIFDEDAIKHYVDSFITFVCKEYDECIWGDEEKLLGIDIRCSKDIDGGIIVSMEPTNMFTACVLFDKYIPDIFISPGQKEVISRDFSKIIYQDGTYYLLEVDETKVKSKDELRMMSVAEHEKYYDNLPYKSAVITFSFPVSVKENDNNVSKKSEDDSLWLESAKKYEQEQKEKKEKFEKENPEVPYGSIELVNGKNYSGRSDGNYEVKTINGKLWFIPGTCCHFGEDM